MSRIAKVPVVIPAGVDIRLDSNRLIIKGNNGQMSCSLGCGVVIEIMDNTVQVQWDKAVKKSAAQAGTVRATLANMVKGVSQGFERKLTMIGVGYRTQLTSDGLSLVLGFSHPVNYKIPEGINIEVSNQTEIIVKGMDKQKVGQVASEIRAYRPPEPYKGKGVRYFDEHVLRKEAKKK